jgi:hypothetical protein
MLRVIKSPAISTSILGASSLRLLKFGDRLQMRC